MREHVAASCFSGGEQPRAARRVSLACTQLRSNPMIGVEGAADGNPKLAGHSAGFVADAYKVVKPAMSPQHTAARNAMSNVST
jgi:hypothetical protein